MNINQVNVVAANKSAVQEATKKDIKKNEVKKQEENVSKDKEVVFEKSSDEKTIEDYGKEAQVKYAADIAAVKEMQKALDKRMQNSFLQMAIDSLGEQQTGIKAALEEILSSRSDEITPEMIAEAKADVAEDGYYGVEATANRLVDFAKALSGGDPSKAEMLKDAFLSAYDQAEEMWGDELPEISKQTKARTEELFDQWMNPSEEVVSEGEVIAE